MRHLSIIALLLAAIASAEEPRCGIVFDREPAAAGLSFDRNRVQPREIELRGGRLAVWTAVQGSDPQRGYGRMLRLRVDDERFRAARMPVVDIEVRFHQAARAGVELWADTAAGMRQVVRLWGGDASLRTMSCRIDDARFAADDGVDLRLLSSTGDLSIRSISILGYDRMRPQWPRLLRSEAVRGDREAFLFAADEAVSLDLPLSNLALVPFAGTWEASLLRPDGGPSWSAAGRLEVAPGETGLLPLRTRMSAPYGVHQLRVSVHAGDGTLAAARTVALGAAASASPLPKASPGSFLYGLDVRNGEIHTRPAYLAWLDALGIDIVRGGAALERLHEAMPVFRARRVQVMAMADIRWQADEARRSEETRRLAALAEATARAHPDLLWWELGNEPDLTGFYAGPIEAYIASANTVAAAVRRGNPAARTMNGGLAFHGRDSIERARRLIERFADGGFDGIAYHGHGPGAAAERQALERLRAAMDDHGLRPGFIIDTETGVAAVAKPAQELVQARTAVQKLVYGQAEGLPMMFWFRLHFEHPDGYGNVVADDPRQPRPVVLALRSLVERLRDLRCAGRLDLGGRALAAYAFASADGRERRLVLWSEDGAERTLAFTLGAEGAVLSHDLFGNQETMASHGGITTVDAGPDPAILSWRAADPARAPQPAEAPVRFLGDAAIATGRTTTVRVAIRNPTIRPLSGTARLLVQAATTIEPRQQTQPIALAPGAATELAFTVSARPSDDGVVWPERWTVFTGIDPLAGDPARITGIPATMPGEDGRPVPARSVAADGGVLDFGYLHGSHRERRLAIAIAEVACDAERPLPILAGADWWMSWAVDGRPVYDTLAGGNGGAIDPPGHAIALPLRPGRNLVAVAVQSGSMGWRLLAADPERSRRLADGVRERMQVVIEDADGVRWAAAVAPLLELARPIRSDRPVLEGPPQAWRIRPGAIRLAESAIVNLWEAHPDRRNWWQGDADLSARVWLVRDLTGLAVVAEVRDDIHRPGDAMRVALSRDGRSEPSIWRSDDADSTGGMLRDEAAGITWHRIALGAHDAGAEGLYLNLVIEDDDRGERKQYLRLRPGFGGAEIQPAAWLRLLTD